MKRFNLLACGLVATLLICQVAIAGEPSRAYFDQQFSALQKASAEIKGDTTQIVSILGNVFEGTVPSGGTLTSLCNKNGWNLIVLMGHNGIANPDNVAAEKKFTYPQTAEGFQAALKKGKPLYDAWLKTKKVTFKVNRIKVDTVEIDRLTVRVAYFTEQLKIKSMEVDQLKIRLAEITKRLKIKQFDIEKLNVDQANFKQVNIDQLHIKQLEVDNLSELLAQANARFAKLKARPPVVTKKIVYKMIDGAGYNPPGAMRLIEDGDICDENIIRGGKVVSSTLEVTGGKSAAVFEMSVRPKKADTHKAKRLFVDANLNAAIPMVWADTGRCVRSYGNSPYEESTLRSMMTKEETLRQANFNEVGKQNFGSVQTENVVVIFQEP